MTPSKPLFLTTSQNSLSAKAMKYPEEKAADLQEKFTALLDAQDGDITDPPKDTLVTPAINESVSDQFNTFLNLLTAQIRNQDPLAPLDSTQFVDQLATFSGLELQASANVSLEEIVELLRR